MNALLNTLVGTRHALGGQYVENTAAMDLFVLATLGFLFFLLGCFATWAWLIWRRSNRPEPHVQLMMELDEPERPAKDEKGVKPTETEEAAPWERPGDWWKQ